MGESGSGKTTLLNILAALDRPTEGEVLLNGMNIVKIPERTLAAFRREHLGFVFQDFNLLDSFSLKDNIFLPLVLSGMKYEEMNRRLQPIAKELGIYELLPKFPYEVSGGQKQRCAVARAIITDPQLILADEPTGALDSKSTEDLLDVFHRINVSGQTIVMVTHSIQLPAMPEECCSSRMAPYSISFIVKTAAMMRCISASARHRPASAWEEGCMNKVFYPRIAMTNLRNNGRTYVPYLLTCILSTAMFYVICSLSLNPDLDMMLGGGYMRTLLQMGTWIVGFFVIIFLFYTNSFLMKRRKKEFGVFNILGMEKRHIRQSHCL